uniref:LAGLIDADG homing endonuclease n=1 Tax=Romanomermis culicivorax TaxID=13658 RepID=A0A915HSG7_ROMCU
MPDFKIPKILSSGWLIPKNSRFWFKKYYQLNTDNQQEALPLPRDFFVNNEKKRHPKIQQKTASSHKTCVIPLTDTWCFGSLAAVFFTLNITTRDWLDEIEHYFTVTYAIHVPNFMQFKISVKSCTIYLQTLPVDQAYEYVENLKSKTNYPV